MAASDRSCLPLFVFVSGKPGSGKSTLAQRLADALSLPLVSNDAIRQGLLETRVGAEDPSARTVDGPTAVGVFYATVEFLLRAGVSLVAEFSFRRGLSEPDLRPLIRIARTINVHCEASIEVSKSRFVEREQTRRRLFVEGIRRHRPDSRARYGAGHIIGQMERGVFDWAAFDPLDLEVPRARVDTTADYTPSLDRIVEFIRSASQVERSP